MNIRRRDIVGRMVLGRYRVVRPLAKGGMGIVYLGRVEGAAGFAKPVVIKTVVPSLTRDVDVAAMFVREARILANLQHPSIVGVLDFGDVDDSYMMVLEYVHGYHLGQWIRYLRECRRVMSVDHAVYITLRVLEALHYAHQLTRPDGSTLGIVHRDISPANILIDVQGHIKLHDFGIARMTDDASGYRTEVGTFKGTYAFASPEALQGLAATPRSDLYSCAVVLHQILSGTHPFKGPTPTETIRRTLHEVAPSLSILRDDVPRSVSAAVDRALLKDPEARFPTAALFAEALRAGLQRSEDETTRDFASVIAADFSGGLSERLGLESLALRDQSWRQIQDGLRSDDSMSPPGPPARSADSLAQLAYQQDRALRASLPTIVAARDEIERPVGRAEVPVAIAKPPHVSVRSWPSRHRPGSRGWWLGMGAISAVAVFATGAAGWLTFRGSAPPPATSVIVITRQYVSDEHRDSTPTSSPQTDVSPPPSTIGSGSVQPPVGGVPKTTPANDAVGFSRAFQKQHSRVEQCFSRFAKDIEGHPRFAVRFTIHPAGTVDKAEISPPALNATDLGQCVLTVARNTRFEPQPESVTFTIPISARKKP